MRCRADSDDGGCAPINLLVQGTTYMDMFDPASHCLFAPGELADRFAEWDVVGSSNREFDAPGGRVKAFATVIARKPDAGRRIGA